MKDKNFLRWLRDRLEFVHGENPNTDYMLKLKALADKKKKKKKLPVEIVPFADGNIFCPDCGIVSSSHDLIRNHKDPNNINKSRCPSCGAYDWVYSCG